MTERIAATFGTIAVMLTLAAYGPWTVARLRKKADPAPALPDGWRLADHPDNGRVLVIHVSGDTAVYAVPFKTIGIRTYISPVSDLTFVDTDNQTTEEA